MPNRRLYVICRGDLDKVYAAVQGGHATALHKQDFSDRWNADEYLIYLAVESEDALVFWRDKIKRKGIKFVQFHEPDLDGQLTAVACVSDGAMFSKLPNL
jgi:hypothetical protein